MRTTLTLDPDVAARVEQIRRTRRIGLRELINVALRRGLQTFDEKRPPRKVVRTQGVALGPRRSEVDDVADVLALSEGEEYK